MPNLPLFTSYQVMPDGSLVWYNTQTGDLLLQIYFDGELEGLEDGEKIDVLMAAIQKVITLTNNNGGSLQCQ